MGFFTWHQRQTEQWIARLGITPYQALWWAWGKGIVLGAIGYWLLVVAGLIRAGALVGSAHAMLVDASCKMPEFAPEEAKRVTGGDCGAPPSVIQAALAPGMAASRERV